TLDEDDPVGLERDDGAHLLQDGDEVENLGLNRRILKLGDTLGAHGGEDDLLGGPHARVGQLDDGALESVRGGEVDALVALVNDGTEGAEGVEVKVDGAVADAAAAEVRDERFAEAVQQGAAE